MVFEASGDFEQALRLRRCEVDGKSIEVLDWRDGKSAATFGTRKGARAAITRTEHVRRAIDLALPEARFCVVVPVDLLEVEP
jgi:hypothetical protein